MKNDENQRLFPFPIYLDFFLLLFIWANLFRSTMYYSGYLSASVRHQHDLVMNEFETYHFFFHLSRND